MNEAGINETGIKSPLLKEGLGGLLYLVPTPLGNLKDITLRALEVLQQADVILCEDTRTSSKLLQHYAITRPVSPYHQHNEHKVLNHLVEQLSSGKNIALITD